MKWTALSLVLIAVAAGCMNHNKDQAPANSSALDITPPAAPPQQNQAAAAQPVYDVTAAQPVSGASAQQTAIAGGSKYTVKKGDSLWKIAATRYGNGNQWPKIASANPGLTAETLKAGQTITIP